MNRSQLVRGEGCVGPAARRPALPNLVRRKGGLFEEGLSARQGPKGTERVAEAASSPETQEPGAKLGEVKLPFKRTSEGEDGKPRQAALAPCRGQNRYGGCTSFKKKQKPERN